MVSLTSTKNVGPKVLQGTKCYMKKSAWLHKCDDGCTSWMCHVFMRWASIIPSIKRLVPCYMIGGSLTCCYSNKIQKIDEYSIFREELREDILLDVPNLGNYIGLKFVCEKSTSSKFCCSHNANTMHISCKDEKNNVF